MYDTTRRDRQQHRGEGIPQHISTKDRRLQYDGNEGPHAPWLVLSLFVCVLLLVGWEKPGPDSPHTVKNRVLTLLYGDVKLLLQMPLIWINIVVILMEIVVG